MEIKKLKRVRLSKVKLDTIISCFIADTTSKQAALISRVNVNTSERYFKIFRGVLCKLALEERKATSLSNGIEVDESYFGPKRVRGKRGRGAGRKVIVLGLLKRQGKVYTQIINTAEKSEIMPIIRQVVRSGSDIYTDGWRSYKALVVYGYNHKKVLHSKDEFAKPDGTHINGVESFWSWAKRRLAKFNGIPKSQFGIHLLECEWRFNHREEMQDTLRKMLRKLTVN